MLREQSGDEAGIRLPAWIVPDFTDLGQYTHTSTSEVTAGKRSRWAGQSGPHKSTGTVSEAAHRLCCSCSPSERNVVVGTITTCVEMERSWGGRLWKIKDENVQIVPSASHCPCVSLVLGWRRSQGTGGERTRRERTSGPDQRQGTWKSQDDQTNQVYFGRTRNWVPGA